MRARSRHPEDFYKNVLRNFAKFTGKHLCLRPATLLKKRVSGTGVFLRIFVKFLRTPFLIEPLRRLHLESLQKYFMSATDGIGCNSRSESNNTETIFEIEQDHVSEVARFPP